MSILITGIDMPTGCWMCFARTDVNIGVGIADGCNLLKEMISNPNERLPDCPLVPVPPHGKLIDADVLLEWANADLRFGDPDFHAGLWHAVSAIKDAPTIIPAEETNKEAANDQNNS